MLPMRQIKFFPGCIAGILPLLLTAYAASGSEQRDSVRYIKAVREYQEPVQVTRHRERIEKVYKAQDAKLSQADKLAEEKKYKEAIAICEDVLAELKLELSGIDSRIAASRQELVTEKIASIKAMWSKNLLDQGRMAAANKKYDDCAGLAAQAAGLSPVYRDEANRLAEYAQGMKGNARREQEISISKVAPNLPEQNQKFKRLLAEARTYLNNGKYDLARDCVEQAFVINPYDREAIALAGKIYRQLFLEGAYRRRSDIAAYVSFSNWQWAEPTFNLVTPSAIPAGVKRTAAVSSDKLKNIRFPGFIFEDADFESIVKYIRERSKEFDSEKDERYKGVAVAHMLTPDVIEKIRVTLSLDNVSLASILECLSLVTGLKYEVSVRNGYTTVTFVTSLNKLVEHTWDAPRNFAQTIHPRGAGAAGAPGAGGAAGGGQGEGGAAAGGSNESALLKLPDPTEEVSSDDFNLSEGLASQQDITITPEELRKYFSDRGVKFPEGSSIYFSSRTQTITAKNTHKEIAALDERISQIAAAVKPLVMVELRAIEISENDYQDLGFEWTIGALTSNTDRDYGNLKDGNKHGWYFGPGVNSQPGYGYSPIRGGNSARTSTTPIINNWNIFPALFGSRNPLGSDIPFNVSLTVNALAHSERTEMLSAPKVVTQDNQTAKVKMQTIYYFPTSWDTMEVEVVTSENSDPIYNIKQPMPEFPDNGNALGIDFTVKPTIRKNRDISLDIVLGLSSYVGPDNYQVVLTGENRYYQGGVLMREIITSSYTVWKPIISSRGLRTSVDVSDGETLVLGGMVQNQAIVRVDKMPFLGDLPLVGRFFQSQAENMERANLLIFVTARLIDDHGVPLKRNHNNGLPEYNR